MAGIKGEALSLGRHFAVFTPVLAAAFMVSQPAGAAVVDLTSGSGSGTINGAVFEFGQGKGGTGVFEPFVRLQATGTEEGYNTDESNVPFDEKTGSWTHDIRLNQIAALNIDGNDWYAFQLDINESGGSSSFLSLDEVQIYTSLTRNKNTTVLASLGTLRYDMDGNGESYVLLDASKSSGSGVADMTVLVPVSAFAGAAGTDFIYLYSFFGEQGTLDGNDYSSDDGFEEWGRPDPAEEPPAAIMKIVKFLDGNEDGLPDFGEELLEGWSFLIHPVGDPDSNQVVTTGPDGSVTVLGLPPGDYLVTEVGIPAGWQQTTNNGNAIVVTVSGETVVEVGNIPEPATIGLLALGGLAVILRKRRRKA